MFGVPRNVSIPQSAFNDGKGSFSMQLPLASQVCRDYVRCGRLCKWWNEWDFDRRRVSGWQMWCQWPNLVTNLSLDVFKVAMSRTYAFCSYPVSIWIERCSPAMWVRTGKFTIYDRLSFLTPSTGLTQCVDIQELFNQWPSWWGYQKRIFSHLIARNTRVWFQKGQLLASNSPRGRVRSTGLLM